jgi:hypothetical protein
MADALARKLALNSVIPTGAERSGGTCCFLDTVARSLAQSKFHSWDATQGNCGGRGLRFAQRAGRSSCSHRNFEVAAASSIWRCDELIVTVRAEGVVRRRVVATPGQRAHRPTPDDHAEFLLWPDLGRTSSFRRPEEGAVLLTFHVEPGVEPLAPRERYRRSTPQNVTTPWEPTILR